MRYFLFIMLIVLFRQPLALASDILVFRSQEREFSVIYDLLKRDLGKYSIDEIVVNSDYNYDKMRAAILAERPKSLILLDNKALHLAKQLRKEADTYLAKMQGVAGMGLNLKKELKDDPQFCGVAYEVPGYTLLTHFRKIYKKPLENVLVLYRKSVFQQEIEDSRRQLSLEKIGLIAVDVEAMGSDEASLIAAIDKGLSDEVSGKKIDAVWVIGDNGLINSKTFGNLWLARARKFSIPFLCGLQQFANPKLNFCSYAASPRDAGIVNQMVQMTLSLLEDHADPGELGVDYLLGTDRVINLKKIQDLNLPVATQNDPELKTLE